MLGDAFAADEAPAVWVPGTLPMLVAGLFNPVLILLVAAPLGLLSSAVMLLESDALGVAILDDFDDAEALSFDCPNLFGVVRLCDGREVREADGVELAAVFDEVVVIEDYGRD